MRDKYYNDAIIGNKSVTASYSSKGELLRLYYPTVDYKQFVDFFHTGIKVNDSSLIYLHDDVNNLYNQYYVENTNILNTEIENTYFKIQIKQQDFVSNSKDILIKKYVLKNNNSMNLDIHFLVHTKMISDVNNSFGSKILKNGLMQYNHNYSFCTFSKREIHKYQLNDVCSNIKTGNLEDKDYIGMSSDSAVSYNLGILQPGESCEFELLIYTNINSEDNHFEDIEKRIEEYNQIDVNKELVQTKKYWEKYVQKHDTLKLKDINKKLMEKAKKIYIRSILLFPLLTNSATGGMSAAIEIDENKNKSGGYSYCWTRDAVFTAQALDLLNMSKETEKFYKTFCKNTQNKDGMWEQRFYTNGNLAPCWGYQIDETASVVYGIYKHYLQNKDAKFLKDTLKMCENAIGFLDKYIENLVGLRDEEDIVKCEIQDKYETENHRYKKSSYDLWEMNEGVHLYSLSSIFAAYTSMIKINEIVEPYFAENRVKLENLKKSTEKLEKYRRELKKYMLTEMCDQNTKSLRRNTKDSMMDVSILGSVVPFEVFTPKEKKVLNTIDNINMRLRTYTGGYLRFENDHYIGGKNPWTIATMWMGLYYKKVGNKAKFNECLEFIINSSSELGFLSEQIDNTKMTPNWVIGLSWAHAMFIMSIGDVS